MPFRHIENAALREAMAKAYDLAREKLGIDGSDTRSGKLVLTIIALGEWESDPKKLSEMALAEIKKPEKRRILSRRSQQPASSR